MRLGNLADVEKGLKKFAPFWLLVDGAAGNRLRCEAAAQCNINMDLL